MVARLIDVTTFLRERGYHIFALDQRPDAVTLRYADPGIRTEVDFFADRVEFKYFRGDEEVFTDMAALEIIARTGTIPPDLAEREESLRQEFLRRRSKGEDPSPAGPERMRCLLNFLDLLHELNIPFALERHMPDSVMVHFARPGLRVEAYFQAADEGRDIVWFSFFTGSEQPQGGVEEFKAFVPKCQDPDFRPPNTLTLAER